MKLLFFALLCFCSVRAAHADLARDEIDAGYKSSDAEKPRAALQHFDRALRLNPSSLEALYGRGQVRRETADFDGSISDFSEILRRDPQFAEAWLERGKTWSEKTQWNKAIADYSRAIRLKPERDLMIDALVRRGMNRKAAGDLKEARRDMDAAIKLDPNDAASWAGRALVRQASGDVTGAKADSDRAATLDPLYGQSLDASRGWDARTLILRGVLAIGALITILGGWSMLRALIKATKEHGL